MSNSHPPERITPLPYRFAEISESYIELRFDNGAENYVIGTANTKTQAEKLVNAANNYPKLEALNKELVEMLNRALSKTDKQEDTEFHMELVELLQRAGKLPKAKGGSNG